LPATSFAVWIAGNKHKKGKYKGSLAPTSIAPAFLIL